MSSCLPVRAARGKSDETYLSELKARLSGHITGDYSLGDVRIYYPGASIGIVEVDPTQVGKKAPLSCWINSLFNDFSGAWREKNNGYYADRGDCCRCRYAAGLVVIPLVSPISLYRLPALASR